MDDTQKITEKEETKFWEQMRGSYEKLSPERKKQEDIRLDMLDSNISLTKAEKKILDDIRYRCNTKEYVTKEEVEWLLQLVHKLEG